MPKWMGAVHPRMRGERIFSRLKKSCQTGSSPHARGTPPIAGYRRGRLRFIPACAGNAIARLKRDTSGSVHPRMRGERSGTVDIPNLFRGSSPHARGTPQGFAITRHGSRFIPACAGNAAAANSSSTGLAVHPRMRGERTTEGKGRPTDGGSSPHARGTRWKFPAASAEKRFIPACAGNAMVTTVSAGLNAVHPRMRGERAVGAALRRHPGGSSPHARGTHH